MKAKLLILGLFCWFGTFAQSVPNTTNFNQQDVTSVVTGIGSNDLVECFAHAVDAYFDPTYKGSKNNLYNFRNYTIPSVFVPTVTTASITSITGTTATGGGNVTSDGGASVTARGVCWNTSTNPTTANGHTSNGTGTGSFTSSLTSLTASTTYYVRAYATNSAGTGYGSNVSFSTQAMGVPIVLTTAASSITSTSATVGGNITSDSGSAVTDRGILLYASNDPTNYVYYPYVHTGTGSFSIYLSYLTPGVTYYFYAWASNSNGMGSGDKLSFIAQ